MHEGYWQKVGCSRAQALARERNFKRMIVKGVLGQFIFMRNHGFLIRHKNHATSKLFIAIQVLLGDLLKEIDKDWDKAKEHL